jgi:hypothetical protein
MNAIRTTPSNTWDNVPDSSESRGGRKTTATAPSTGPATVPVPREDHGHDKHERADEGEP